MPRSSKFSLSLGFLTKTPNTYPLHFIHAHATPIWSSLFTLKTWKCFWTRDNRQSPKTYVKCVVPRYTCWMSNLCAGEKLQSPSCWSAYATPRWTATTWHSVQHSLPSSDQVMIYSNVLAFNIQLILCTTLKCWCFPHYNPVTTRASRCLWLIGVNKSNWKYWYPSSM